MNVTRRKQAAELAAKVHQVLVEAQALHVQEALAIKARGFPIVSGDERYDAIGTLYEVAHDIESALALLVDLPTIGAPVSPNGSH